MAEGRRDFCSLFFLIYLVFLIFSSHTTPVLQTNIEGAKNSLFGDTNTTLRCNIQLQTKIGRELRMAKSEITTNNQDEILLTLVANNGSVCTKLRGVLSILVTYKKANVSRGIDGYIFSRIVPSNALIEGNCEQEATSSMKISWNEYTLVWNFAKTPGRKRWYVSQIDLIINTRTEGFRKFAFCGKSFTFSTIQPMFPTPLGYSYLAFNKSALHLVLTDGKDVSPTSNFTAKIYLRENFQLQPFIGSSADFGPLFEFDNEIRSPLDTTTVATTEISETSSVLPENDTLGLDASTEENYPSTTTMETNDTITNSTEEKGFVSYSLHDFGPFKCVVLKTDGLIEISFESPANDSNIVSTYLPSDAIVEGSCLPNEAWMRVSWNGYSMRWSFVQEEFEGWWVTQIEVTVCAGNEFFESIAVSGHPIKLAHKKEKIIYKRPGCTFKSDEFVVNLSSSKEVYNEFKLSGKMILRNLELGAFLIFDKN